MSTLRRADAVSIPASPEDVLNAAIETLLRLESLHGLWDAKVLGYPVWPHLRLRAYNRLLQHGQAAPAATKRARSLERAPASLQDLVQKLLPAVGQRDIWVLGSTAYRRWIGHDSKSVFAHDVDRAFSDRVVYLETNPTNQNRIADGNVVFLDALFDTARTLAARTARFVPHAVADHICRFGELGLSPFEVIREAAFGQLWRGVSELLVAGARPKAAFVLCSYNQHIPLQAVLRNAGVPLIELQHGVIHESHPGYVFEPSFAAPHAPDQLVVFGKHYGQLLDRVSPYFRGRWHVGGHPWIRTKLEGRKPAVEPLVVVFGQNVGFVQSHLDKFAAELRAVLPADTRVVLKPHPNEKEVERVYENATSAGVELASPQVDSYDLLSRCRLAVCMFSTIAVEALAFSCTSVVLPSPNWFDELKLLVEQGFVQVAESAADVARLCDATRDGSELGDIAQRLFGVGEAPLDFSALLPNV